MANARDCGIVRTALQGLGSGYFGKSIGNTFPIEQSDRVLKIRNKDIGYLGLGTVEYR